MTKKQEDLIKKATEALGKNLVSHTLPQKERFEIQSVFAEVISELEQCIEAAEFIPNLCPMGCDQGDQCPSICPNYNYEEDEDE